MLCLIGDVHGQMEEYLDIVAQHEYTLQVGDLGFDYDALMQIDPEKHKFLGGNHDNYDDYYDVPHSIGDYGCMNHGHIPFFFVRGSFSIDILPRMRSYALGNYKTWWYEEELSQEQLDQAVLMYESIKPDIVVTHDFPREIKDRWSTDDFLRLFGLPNDLTCRTQAMLQKMFEIHQPRLWIGGHWHRTVTEKAGNTTFQCIDIRDFITVEQVFDNYRVTIGSTLEQYDV